MTRNDRIIAIVACLAALAVVPEVRRFLRLSSIGSESGDHSEESRPPSADSSQNLRSSGSHTSTSEKQSAGHEPTTPSSQSETQPTEVPAPKSAPSVSSLAVDEGQTYLVPFQVLPKDTAIYLDDKPIGTAEELSDGILIPAGFHVLTFVRRGYESQEFRALFDQPGIGVKVTLRPR
jgi:hypothetical protein